MKTKNASKSLYRLESHQATRDFTMTIWTDNRKKPAQKKRIPQMPEGYYSGDKPNPNLRAFVQAHLAERPYDPETDKYNVPAFDHAALT